MHWKIVRAIGVMGALVVASAVVVGKLVMAALEPESYEKDEENDDQRQR